MGETAESTVQLDRTHVVIRLRTLSEIGDLSLVMLRRYPSALLVGFLFGALPWMLIDIAVLAWIPIDESRFGLDDDEAAVEMYRYLLWMIVLVISQAPAAGVATSFYLGQAVFEQRPTWSSVFTEVRRQFWRWFYVLGMRRLAVPILVVAMIRMFQPHDGLLDFVVPLGFLIAVIAIRNSRPFAPEILILEQCPLKSKQPHAITYGRRSKSLHSPISGELSGRFIAISFVLMILWLSVLYTLVWLRGIATGIWNWDLFCYLVMVPASLWLVAGLSSFVRLLCYLDTRIRLEGWEVELAIRAEAMRQFGQDQPIHKASPSEVPPRKSTGAIVVLLLLISCLSSSVALAQNDAAESVSRPSAETLRSTPWYDADEQRVIPVTVRPQADDSLNRDSRWLPKAERVRSASKPASSTTSAWNWPSGQIFAWLILGALLIVIVAALVYGFSQAEIELGPRASLQRRLSEAPDEQMIQRMQELPAELRHVTGNLRDQTVQLIQAGRYDLAIITLFGHQLLLLDQAGMLRLSRGKTNGRYIRETRSVDNSAAGLFQRTVGEFERCYFGRYSLVKDEMERLWQDNLELEGIVHARHEVAA